MNQAFSLKCDQIPSKLGEQVEQLPTCAADPEASLSSSRKIPNGLTGVLERKSRPLRVRSVFWHGGSKISAEYVVGSTNGEHETVLGIAIDRRFGKAVVCSLKKST